MLIKFSTTDDFKSDVIPAAIVTDPSHLVKRAGSEKFKNVKVAKNQVPVHLIALGSYEGTGANRNLDMFLEKDCRNNHSTFVKAGRAVHWNHKNKKNDPKYGDIYASDYNEPMKRIELLIGLDKDNSKNADVLTKIEKGGQVPFSMASRQAFDLCSICKHKAPDSEHRCEHIPSQLGEITKEGNMVMMINPNPNWFEISLVHKPADRVAYSLNSSSKEASDNDIQDRYNNNLKQAQEIYLPSSLILSKYASSKRSLLNKISKLEKHIDAVASGKIENSRDKYIKEHASKLNQAEQISEKTLSELRKFDHHKLLKCLADNGIIFTPEEFYKYLFDNRMNESHLEDMKSHLPSAHQSLQNEDEEINNEDFNPDEISSVPSSIMNLVKELTNDHSLFGDKAHNRVMRITIIKRMAPELKKESSVKSTSLFGKQLALKYANYQLSALNYLDGNNSLTDELIINTLVQNRR